MWEDSPFIVSFLASERKIQNIGPNEAPRFAVTQSIQAKTGPAGAADSAARQVGSSNPGGRVETTGVHTSKRGPASGTMSNPWGQCHRQHTPGLVPMHQEWPGSNRRAGACSSHCEAPDCINHSTESKCRKAVTKVSLLTPGNVEKSCKVKMKNL